MADKRLRRPSILHGEATVLDDMQVSRDAVDFLAFYGSKTPEIHRGLLDVFSTLPRGNRDLARHWEKVAARVGEMVSEARPWKH